MWNYSFILPNFTILTVFLIFYFFQPRVPIRVNRAFLCILFGEMGIIISDVAASACLEYLPQLPPAVHRQLNTLYFFLFILRSLFCFTFSENTVRRHIKHSPLNFMQRGIIFLLGGAIILSSPFTEAVFSISAEGKYARGPLYNIIYIVAFYYLALSFLYLIVYRKKLPSGTFKYAILSNLLLCAGYGARILFPRHIIMQNFTLLFIIIIYLTYENPSIYIEGKSGNFNRLALIELLSEMNAEKTYLVMGFTIHNYSELREIYRGPQLDLAIQQVGQYLVKTYPKLIAFYLHDGCFILVGNNASQQKMVRDEIARRFLQPWNIGDKENIYLEIGFAHLSPELRTDNPEKILNGLLSVLKELGTENNADANVTARTIKEIEYKTSVKRAIEQALEQNSVEIYLQPLIGVRNRGLVGAEALARLRNEEGDLLPPNDFIPIAEKNGRINQLGEQVFEKACRFIHEHDIAAMGISWINVNLSPIQFLRKDLNDRFSAILARYSVDARNIQLEITEASMIDYALLQKQIKTMQQTGFQFVLDDYGSGYSNIGRLRRCPFINIKLDMEIVWDYFKNHDKLLPAFIQVFKQMNFSVTAEGIETAEMAQEMKKLGCDYLQGYYFSKPVPSDEFAKTYKKGGA